MTKRLYYTCPIQALYMQLNFGVGLYFETKDGDVDFNPQEYADNVDLWLSGYNGRTKIYVENESEHILEPKEGDIVDRVDPTPHNNFYKATLGDVNAFKTGNWNLRIIMRDNKQFFQAEVENV